MEMTSKSTVKEGQRKIGKMGGGGIVDLQLKCLLSGFVVVVFKR